MPTKAARPRKTKMPAYSAAAASAVRLEPARRNAVHRSRARLRTRCPQIGRGSRRGIRVRRLFAKSGMLTYDPASIGAHRGEHFVYQERLAACSDPCRTESYDHRVRRRPGSGAGRAGATAHASRLVSCIPARRTYVRDIRAKILAGERQLSVDRYAPRVVVRYRTRHLQPPRGGARTDVAARDRDSDSGFRVPISRRWQRRCFSCSNSDAPARSPTRHMRPPLASVTATIEWNGGPCK